MIKINLLGVPAPTPKAAAAAPAPASKAMQTGILIGAFVVCFGTVGLLYQLWNSQIGALNVELKKQRAEQARLAAIKAENAKYEAERLLLEQRINAIQLLQAGRVGPAEFMNALAKVVNQTNSDLYLFSVAPQGDRLVLRGQSGSVDSVATLLYSMKTSGYFEDVQLRQFYEDDVENRLSYKFNLDCAHRLASVAASALPAGRATSAPIPSRHPGT